MQGRRVQTAVYELEPGDYCLVEDEWYGKTPNGLLAGLRRHQIVENADGTITVSPSILVTQGEGLPQWHGYLENGFWREC
jgi:hypothetical protein